MSQGIFSNINPAATSGNQLATILNIFKDAIASMLKAPTRDPNLQAGGIWLDDSQEGSPNFKWYLKQWTGTQDILICTIDIQNFTVSFAGADTVFSLTKTSADSVGAILKFIKKRVANNGQTLFGDILGQIDLQSTDNSGTQRTSFRMKVIANDDALSTEFGAYLVLEQVNTDGATLSEKVRLRDGKFGIGTNNPLAILHIKDVTGQIIENEEDTTNPAKVKLRKKRVSNNGRVDSGDEIGKFTVSSTDQNGAEVEDALTVVATATENHLDTQHGTKVDFKTKSQGAVVATTKQTFHETGVVEHPLGSKSKSHVLGTHATANTNAKLHRAGTAKMQVVQGGDATAEGSEATTLAELSSRTENFTFAGLPAFGNAGRKVWVTDRLSYYVDTGTAWRVVGSGGGGSSVRWEDGSNPPIPMQDAQFNQYREYVAGETQNIVAAIKVPSSYPGGIQIKAIVEFYHPDSSGTVLLQTVATLIRKNTDLISSTTNQRTSTNSAITMTSGLQNRVQPVEFDLTDASGNINGVAVSANDLILVTLKRGTDTATSAARVLDKTSELSIG